MSRSGGRGAARLGARRSPARTARQSSGSSASCARSSCRSSRCWWRWSARDSSSTQSASRRSARGWRRRIDELEAEIYEAAGREFTIGSPSQLGEVLFVELGLTRKRRGKTGYSTDARVLSQIRDENPIVPAVEQWRELTKLKNTYLDSLPGLIDPETGRIHTTFNQVTAATGRLSSTNPNLQNIPIRSEVGRPVRALLRRGRGQSAALVRLQPGRAARPRARRGRGRPARDLRDGRGCPLGDGRGHHRRRPRRDHARPSARRRRWSTTASPTA